MAPAAVGALAGLRAVEGNRERQDEERSSRDAGAFFEPTPQAPPLDLYGPDGRRVAGGTVEVTGSEESDRIEASDEVDEAEGRRDSTTAQDASEPSLEEQRQLQQLRSRDTEVRTHEAAHVASGGSYVRGGASFGFETGPDGKQYAVSGEVGIDTSPVPGDPQATAAKARTVRAAALAPASPSGADRAIAAQAAQMEGQAMAELAAAQREQAAGGDGTPWDRYVRQQQPGSTTPAAGLDRVA